MRKASIFALAATACALWFVNGTAGQSNTGTLDLTARITPTAARPEPVRQFTFYVLRKSYAEIQKEVEQKEGMPSRDAFIDDLKVSPELRTWLKGHDTMDLTSIDLDKLLTPDDIIHVPEFLRAYQRSNSGMTTAMPQPKFVEADKTAHPEKYEKQKQDYLTALKKFIQSRPETVSGVELELGEVSPHRKWMALENERRRRVQRMAPDIAQLQYLAGKADTDLDGRATISGLPPGVYWISSLNLDARAGDTHLGWDVPVIVEPGKTIRVELTNVNSFEAQGYTR